MWPRSLGGRLALSLGAALLALWIVSAGSAAVIVARELNEVFDSILQETAQILLPDLTARYGPQLEAFTGDAPLAANAAIPHDEYITWRLFSADGRLLMRSHRAPAASPPLPGFITIDDARIYTERSPDGRYLLSVAEPPFHRQHTIGPTLRRLLGPQLAVIVLALVAVPFIVRRGFAPVRALQADIARRGGSNLEPIAAPGLPRELGAIRDDVNMLLRRLRQALDSERSFSANAAHELRTPVAAVSAQAQLLLARLPAESPERHEAEEMVAALRRLGGRLEKLLQLARAEAGVALGIEPVDLLVPLHLIIEEFGGDGPTSERLRFDDGGLGEVMVAGDLDALGIVLRNLVENALRHSPPDTPVEVSVSADGVVRVVNAGPVVPEARLATLTRRFVSHGGRGSGLGLSIVAAIVEQMGARLELRSPASGRADGLEAILALAPARGGVRSA